MNIVNIIYHRFYFPCVIPNYISFYLHFYTILLLLCLGKKIIKSKKNSKLKSAHLRYHSFRAAMTRQPNTVRMLQKRQNYQKYLSVSITRKTYIIFIYNGVEFEPATFAETRNDSYLKLFSWFYVWERFYVFYKFIIIFPIIIYYMINFYTI